LTGSPGHPDESLAIPNMSFRDPVVAAAIGILSLIAFELVYRSSQPLPSVRARVEWLSWGLIYAFSKLRQWHAQGGFTETNYTADDKNHRSNILALLIFITQLLRRIIDVSWIFVRKSLSH
jgi:hypothetical protein